MADLRAMSETVLQFILAAVVAVTLARMLSALRARREAVTA